MEQKTSGLTLSRHKILRWVLSLLFAVSILSACSPKLPGGLNEEQVTNQAKQVVAQINAADYNAVEAQFSDTMKTALPAGALETAIGGIITNLGTFKNFTSSAVEGGETARAGKYAVVVLRAAYENGSAMYTISIDEAGKLTGLYVK